MIQSALVKADSTETILQKKDKFQRDIEKY